MFGLSDDRAWYCRCVCSRSVSSINFNFSEWPLFDKPIFRYCDCSLFLHLSETDFAQCDGEQANELADCSSSCDQYAQIREKVHYAYLHRPSRSAPKILLVISDLGRRAIFHTQWRTRGPGATCRVPCGGAAAPTVQRE